MSKFIGDYFRAISIHKDAEEVMEFTLRSPLQNLLEGLAKLPEVRQKSGKITVRHEPSRKAGIGAPDFFLLNDGGAIIGYVECKKPGENLDKLIGGKQLDKYSGFSDNVLLTDYRRFIRLHKGKPTGEITLPASKPPTAKQKEELQNLIAEFMSAAIRLIDDPKTLAKILAGRCKALRDELEEKLSDNSGNNPTAEELITLQQAFKGALLDDKTPEKFSDALAQTVTYTLLMIKLQNLQSGEKLTDIYGLEKHIPKNYALIRGISRFLSNLQDTPLTYLLDGILAVINAVDAAALTEKMGASGGTDDDPYFYFYENFLAAYDAKLRKRRGVYYTPPAAVKFIVRATDNILRRDFGKSEGLADSSVTVLDFAAGTGTFMLEIIRLALDGKSAAKRDIIARHHLLQNLYGFEVVISSYVIAHLKLSAFFAESGVELKEGERINIFLTNTLENQEKKNKDGELPVIIPALTKEMEQAQKIKEQNILVITGNPPYSVKSQTKNKHIWGLLRDYYKEGDGKALGETNTRQLHDDYVKFIRFAQKKIDEAGRGIVAIITNHGFLDAPTFRGMRSSLLKSFDRLYFLDLHGNVNVQKLAPGGGKDQNVFGIKQGVAISFLIKDPEGGKGVFHADFWGTREEKKKACLETVMDTVGWKEIQPTSPFYLFIPQDEKARAEYENENFYSLKKMFDVSGSGIVAGRDKLTIHYWREEAEAVVKEFTNMPPEEARSRFNLGIDARDWRVERAQEDLRRSGLKSNNFYPIAYRPFDMRHTYYTGNSRGFHVTPCYYLMKHMLAGDNLGLVSVRQSPTGVWQHVFATDKIMESCHISNKGREINYLFPLYLYGEEMGKTVRRENFTSDFRAWLDFRYGEEHTPENILYCIYAVMHSPEYRQKYAGFMQTDFPRVPFPKDNKSFLRYASIGKKLMDAHLLRANCGGKIKLQGSGTSHKVEKVDYDKKAERLYFNKDEYLSPLPPEIFNFKVGGYKPLEKFLQYRKGRNISGDIETLEKAANALAYTVRLMKDIPLP